MEEGLDECDKFICLRGMLEAKLKLNLIKELLQKLLFFQVFHFIEDLNSAQKFVENVVIFTGVYR